MKTPHFLSTMIHYPSKKGVRAPQVPSSHEFASLSGPPNIASNQTPGRLKSGKLGQLPNFPGSPPIRTHVLWLGVGPSNKKTWNHPIGQMFAFGGAVMVHDVAEEQLKAGKNVRCPMLLPCVDDTAPIRENRTPFTLPVGRLIVTPMFSPYDQSLLVIVRVGCVAPDRR